MNNPNDLRNLLAQHIGSDKLYAHSFVRTFTYTPGVRDFAKHAGGGAYWLLDTLATEPAIHQAVRDNGFAIAVLDVPASADKATLTVADDVDGDRFEGAAFEHKLPTDCPAGQWKFYLVPNVLGEHIVTTCLMPSEY